MAISAVNLSGLSGLVHDFGPKICETAQKSSSPLFADDRVLEKPDPKGGEYVFSVMPAENHASAILADGALLPVGGADLPTKNRVFPANHVGVVEMGRAAAETSIDDELSELFDTTIKNRAAQMSRQIGRALYGTVAVNPSATTWSSTAADATATVTVADLSLFRPGMAVDFRDITANKMYTVRVAGTTYTSGVGGTVSLINDVVNPATGAVVVLTDTTIAVGDSFVLRGALGAGFGAAPTATSSAIGFNDAIGAGSLHGITNAALPGWEGPSRAAGGALSHELLLGFAAQAAQFSGCEHTHVIMSPNLAAAFAAATNNTGTALGGFVATPVPTMDKYKTVTGGMGMTVGGKPLVQDPNCPAAQVVFHNKEFVVAPQWKKLGPDLQDGDKLLSRTNYSYSYQMDARINMAIKKRSALGIVTGITAFA